MSQKKDPKTPKPTKASARTSAIAKKRAAAAKA